MIVGVVGGVAAGKSTVTRLFVERGAAAVDADEVAHEVLELPEIREAIRKQLGTEVFAADGRVDRRAVGQRVFADPEALARLERLVHPEVRRRIEAEVSQFRRSRGRTNVLVLDVPLLATSPLLELCDEVVYVEAGSQVRRDRAGDRGWPPGELDRREAAQPSLDEKRMLAKHWIDNSGALESTRQQVAALYERLLASEEGKAAAAPLLRKNHE